MSDTERDAKLREHLKGIELAEECGSYAVVRSHLRDALALLGPEEEEPAWTMSDHGHLIDERGNSAPVVLVGDALADTLAALRPFAEDLSGQWAGVAGDGARSFLAFLDKHGVRDE